VIVFAAGCWDLGRQPGIEAAAAAASLVRGVPQAEIG